MTDLAALVAEVKAALQQATPGPWYWGRDWETLEFSEPDSGEGDKYASLQLFGPDERPGTPKEIIPLRVDHYEAIWDVAHPNDGPATADRALIAKSPEWLGALVQAVEDQQRQLGRIAVKREDIPERFRRAVDRALFTHGEWVQWRKTSRPEEAERLATEASDAEGKLLEMSRELSADLEAADLWITMSKSRTDELEAEVAQLRADGQRLREASENLFSKLGAMGGGFNGILGAELRELRAALAPGNAP